MQQPANHTRATLVVSETTLRASMPTTVALEDQPRFVALALEEFKTLHASNVIRFGLRPLEFVAWKEQRECS